MSKRDISYEEAKENFIEVDGQIYKKVGSLNQNRYITIGYKNKYLLAHRLVFLLHHGYIPDVVDHIDGNPSHNNINNLRAATKSTNAMNRSARSDSKTGIKNVYPYKKGWAVNINVNKKRTHIGYFKDIELAELVAMEARDLYHGEFAKH
jgi:hypothetical protein